MDVKTKFNTVVTVDEDHLITIPEGLFGFEDYKRFALFDSEYQPLLWLQCLDNQNLAFLTIDPFLICSDYELDIDDKNLSAIGLKDPADVYVMAIVTVPADGGAVTANLQGPLIVNKKNRQCMQAILADDRWNTKYNILAALKKREESC